ncbi:MAG: amidohydrolase [Clostridia bacterium]|nr:amidohydrolase [Clostridia bacterium]
MNILIKNCNLISMSDKREKIEENIDILIKAGKINMIAKNIEENVDKVIYANGKIVMPGLINTHAHVPMSIFRETLDGYNLQDWLEKKIWPMEDKLNLEDIYYASLLSFIEMIKTGCTTINDMYFMTDEIIKAGLNSGIRLQTTRTLMDIAKDGEIRIKELEELIERYNDKEETITLNIGIHGFYTTNAPYIEKCANLARKYNKIVHIHFCENSKEREDIIKGYSVQSPVELIKKYFKDLHVVLAHSVKLTKEEIKELANENVHISHCPVSNLKLGCGVANISYMLDKGINVSIGTDGQGSGSNLDLFEAMKYTALLQKGILENPKELPAYEVLKMATVNGAKALGLEEKIGAIEENKSADIIIINMDTVTSIPINNVFSQIVYNIKGTNVETTIINGKIVMENRVVKGINESDIYNKCNQIIKRIR